MNGPELLLADEPTGNLDSRTSAEIIAMLRDLNRTSALTIVIVTHDPEVAAAADRVITFRDGRIIGDASAAEHGRQRSPAPTPAARPGTSSPGAPSTPTP